MAFSQDLIAWRTKRGWTQRQLAVELDVPERTVQRWESGSEPHGLARAGVWAKLSNVSQPPLVAIVQAKRILDAQPVKATAFREPILKPSAKSL